MFNVTVPPTSEQGSYVTKAADRAAALWDYNSARAHDGLPPLSRMPAGTKYERITPAPVPPTNQTGKVTTHAGRQYHAIFTVDPDTIRAALPPYWAYDYADGLYILDTSKGEKIGYLYPHTVREFAPDQLAGVKGV